MASPAATPDEHNQYRQIVGALIYLSVLTRPDITEAVSRLCRFMHAPTIAHLQDALYLLRYLKGTPEFGVIFVAQHGNLSLIGHSDNNFTTPSSAGKSVSGYVFNLGTGAISYRSKRQSTIPKSTSEAEYVALGIATAEALYMR